MKLATGVVNTRFIPDISSILKFYCPSVLRTRCFNDRNLPFREEVKATEIGHLFEHILLEELCIKKLACGARNAVFNGRTNWNWIKEPQGLFHISIDAGFSDQLYMESALNRAIEITQVVLTHIPVSHTYANHPLMSVAELETYLSM